MDRVLSGCSQEARARSSPRGPPTTPAALRPSSPPPQRPARWRRATFRLPLWGLTLRRSRWALERRQRGEPSSPPARQREREAATLLCRLPQAANSRRLWPSMFYLYAIQALLDTVFGIRLEPGETDGIDRYLQPPSK